MINQPNDISAKKRISIILLWVIIGLLVLIIAISGTLMALVLIGKNNLLDNSNASIITPESMVETEGNDGKTIYYKGQKYIFNENITSLLFMGIDKENLSDTSETFGANGQADVLVLIALDTSNGKMKAIPISRDTMVDVNQYSISGQYIGISKEQICLSYSYGDGGKLSCENTVTSVSRLLYGMPINSYVALDLKGIKILNDSIGGVTVTVDKDIDLFDKHLKKGDTVTLKGEYALKYIRGRDQVSLEANNDRMSRQKNYIRAFYKSTIKMTKKDITTPVKMYNRISKYKFSDLSVADISYLTQCVLLNRSTDMTFASISGKNVAGEKYVEFYPDYEALYELVIDTFYKPAS